MQYTYGPPQVPPDSPFNWHSMFGSGIGIGDIIFVIVIFIALQLLWGLVVGPHWRVWRAHQVGLADLAMAKNEQQIQIAKAQSRLDAAELNKKASIVNLRRGPMAVSFGMPHNYKNGPQESLMAWSQQN
jgi:hypothetical protein